MELLAVIAPLPSPSPLCWPIGKCPQHAVNNCSTFSCKPSARRTVGCWGLVHQSEVVHTYYNAELWTCSDPWQDPILMVVKSAVATTPTADQMWFVPNTSQCNMQVLKLQWSLHLPQPHPSAALLHSRRTAQVTSRGGSKGVMQEIFCEVTPTFTWPNMVHFIWRQFSGGAEPGFEAKITATIRQRVRRGVHMH